MRIAMVTEYLASKGAPHFGGVDARTINLARRLAGEHEVHIITSYLEGTERLEQYDAVTIHRVGRRRTFTQRGDFFNRFHFNFAIAAKIQERNQILWMQVVLLPITVVIEVHLK